MCYYQNVHYCTCSIIINNIAVTICRLPTALTLHTLHFAHTLYLRFSPYTGNNSLVGINLPVLAMATYFALPSSYVIQRNSPQMCFYQKETCFRKNMFLKKHPPSLSVFSVSSYSFLCASKDTCSLESRICAKESQVTFLKRASLLGKILCRRFTKTSAGMHCVSSDGKKKSYIHTKSRNVDHKLVGNRSFSCSFL